MEVFIIPLFFILPFIMPIMTFNLAKFITKKEKQELELSQNKNLFTQAQKAVMVFKIATILLFSIPLLFLIPHIINPPYNDGAQGALFFIFLPSTLFIFIPAIAGIHGYNYLFYTTSNKNAFFILAVPFTPTLLLGFLATIKAIQGDWAIVNGHVAAILILPSLFVLGIMAVILFILRKKFKNQKQQSNT
jgi:hypothetical protein